MDTATRVCDAFSVAQKQSTPSLASLQLSFETTTEDFALRGRDAEQRLLSSMPRSDYFPFVRRTHS